MVCLYCGGETQVTNSRLQKRDNHVWRRRKCILCSSVFTTQENPVLDTSHVIKNNDLRLQPFNRDRLYISIYEACKHRESAVKDAAYLTAIIVAKILASQTSGSVARDDIVKMATQTLKYFDQAAATVYAAYHHA